MNKKGFISTTTVYSFFLVFLLMLLFIVNNLVSNRTLLNGIKEKIKEEIAISSFASHIINEVYTTDGENGLYYHDADLTNGANDNNYRYSGSNPNNYVKFNNELWRRIGVINGKVKIIRNEAITTRTYTDNNKNDYVESSLYNYLNGEYLNNTLVDFKDKIDNNYWYVPSDKEIVNTLTANGVYSLELGENSNAYGAVYSKVGLLYISDYAYAAAPGDWVKKVNEYNTANNWLKNVPNMWTMVRDFNNIKNFFYIDTSGNVASGEITNTYSVRPVVVLSNSNRYISGSGSEMDPYIIGG